MGTYRTLFAVFSVLSLATLIWTGGREALPEWKSYQQEYYTILQGKLEAQGTKDFHRPQLQILQTWLPSIGRVDRCTTCHMGIENREYFASAPQPFTAHPGKYLEWHPVNKFGCTVCHHGQGLSTEFTEAAHTPPDLEVSRYRRLIAWGRKGVDLTQYGYTVEDLEKKVADAEGKAQLWKKAYGYEELEFFHDYMLPKKYIESSCMKCHDSRAIEPYAPTIAAARKLIHETFKCRKCHTIPEIVDEPGEPQAPCPELQGFGDKTDHNLDFGSPDTRDQSNELVHTAEEIEVLRTMRRDPLSWTVEHFINPQLFIITSQMANFGMTYPQAETLAAYVHGLAKELPARDYVAGKPELPPEALAEDAPSMFVPSRSVLIAASEAHVEPLATPIVRTPAAATPVAPPPAAPGAEASGEPAPSTEGEPAVTPPAAPEPTAAPDR
jgi:hypothetical protein